MEDIGLVILAAGRSVRMGEPKLVLPLAGKPLLEHILQKTSEDSWGQKIAVIGEPREVLEQLCQRYGFVTVFNSKPHKGQSYSLRLGIKGLSGELKGLIFLPGDQPLVSSGLLKALVQRFKTVNNNKTIIVPCYGEDNCSPVLFGCGWFPDLSLIEGDRGGRQIIKENPYLVEKVRWHDYRDFLDVDTKEDYENICKEMI